MCWILVRGMESKGFCFGFLKQTFGLATTSAKKRGAIIRCFIWRKRVEFVFKLKLNCRIIIIVVSVNGTLALLNQSSV